MSTIGEVTSRVHTWNPRSSAASTFQYLDLSAVDNESKAIVGAVALSTSEAPSRARQLVAAGDVLVSTVRPNLNAVAMVPESLDGATASTGFTVLRPTDAVDRRYLFHWVRTPMFVHDMVRKATGASYPAVSDRVIKSSTLPLPPLAEQRRIAAILDGADALMNKRSRALACLDDLTRSIFLEMFGEPRAGKTHWPLVPLGEVSVIDGQYGANVPSTDYSPHLPRYVRITDITESGTLTSDARSPSGSASDWGRYELAEGDLLFARSGATVGKTYLHTDPDLYSVFAGYLIRFRLREDVARPRFIFEFTKTLAYKSWVQARQNVVAQPNVNAKQYATELQVPVPPITWQREFEKVAQGVDETRAAMFAAEAAQKRLLAALQSRAFSAVSNLG